MLSYEERLAKVKHFYTAIRKTLTHLLRESAEEWLKRFRHEPWYEAAVEAYVQQAQLTVDGFNNLKRRVLQTIDQEDLYQVLPEPPKLGGGIKRKQQGITRYKTWEYLDERYNRVVVDDVRDELVELQKDFRQKLDECYQKVMIDTLVPETGKALYNHLAMSFDFNRYDEATRDYLRDKKIHWRNQVADETEREIKAQLVKGYEEGLSSYAIAENIGQSSGFKLERAEKIARTEVMSACNYAQYAAAEINDDVVGHYWRSQGTARSRMSHRRANGQYRPKGEPFTIGGAKMMYPGDGSLGAPAKEIINCRCWLEMVFVGEEPAGAAKVANNHTTDKAVAKNPKVDIMVSGGRITDPDGKEGLAFAKMYYEQIRRFTTDVQHIAQHTGKTEAEIAKIKAYLFIDKSQYNERTGQWAPFDPDCAIAQSWQRLMIGKDIKPHDRILIEHELLEMQIKQDNPEISHEEAHERATEKYDYPSEVIKYYRSLERRRKRQK